MDDTKEAATFTPPNPEGINGVSNVTITSDGEGCWDYTAHVAGRIVKMNIGFPPGLASQFVTAEAIARKLADAAWPLVEPAAAEGKAVSPQPDDKATNRQEYPDTISIPLAELFGASLRRKAPEFKVTPASVEVARWLVDGALYQPQPGDIVQLRPDVEQYDGTITYPKPGERVAVTQVMYPPMRDDSRLSSASAADRRNMAIVMMATHVCEDPKCEAPQVVEFLHDSRYFEKVGHIDDDQSALTGA